MRYGRSVEGATADEDLSSYPSDTEASWHDDDLRGHRLVVGEEKAHAETWERKGGRKKEEEEEKDRVVYDHYDFALQFRCYVLADKLQTPGFKTLILNEIQYHGEFCNPRELRWITSDMPTKTLSPGRPIETILRQDEMCRDAH